MNEDVNGVSGPAGDDRQSFGILEPLKNAAAALFTRSDSARSVFLAWEGLRLVYNGVLAFLTVSLAFALDVFDGAFLRTCVFGALIANVCFCAGIFGEGYLALVGVDRRIARGLVFLAGLSFTSLTVLVVTYAIWYDRNVP